jgi:outer membrane protein OmpA-like peptidoglycan-associated protein
MTANGAVRLVVVGLAAALVPLPASAASSGRSTTPSATQVTATSTTTSAPSASATRGPVDPAAGPVQDLVLPVEDLTFGEGNLDGSLTSRGDEIIVAADVLFAVDKADLSPKAAALIGDTVERIRQSGAGRLTVVGHTDDQGSDSYNQGLSERRGQAVTAALRAGLGASVTMTARGLGESDPIADNRTERGRTLNRRVEIRLG